MPRFKLFESSLPVSSSPNSDANKTNDAGVGLRMVVVMVLSCMAFLARSLPLLLVLSAANMVILFWLRCNPLSLKRELRIFLWQTTVILTLYLIRFQSAAGLWIGFTVSWRMFMAFLPVMVFSRTTSQAGIIRILTRVMSARMAFVLSTCLKFVPQLLAEVKNIYEGQVLRGARILPRDLLRPWHWPDLLHCVIVPAVVQGMVLAGNIALAARARGFGRHARRTCWPGV